MTTTDGTAYHLGIDLGTTYVAAGILEQGRPEIITLGDRSAVLPSVLYFREDGDVLTGESATRRGLSDPTRVVREFKRRVGDTTPVIVGQTPYSVDVLMSKLVRFVYDAVVERQGSIPQSITITHPANWGPYKIDVLEQAVRLAELGEVRTITEPVAAAIHYAAAERLQPQETVAVYDLGGGTFDAAVLRKTEDDFVVLGEVEGIERLGGIDFDEAVFQHVVRFCESSLSELDIDDPASIQALARLRQECVEAKEVLSTDTEVTIPVVLPNLQTEVRLTRAEFEAMIRPLLTQTVEALLRAIRSAEVNAQELSAVLLVGGCSRIPLISEMVGAELGRPIAVDRHPKHTVALGAAISAGRSEQAPEPKVDDWFRTEPSTTVAPQDGRSAAAALTAATAGAAAASSTDDPYSMFPAKDDQTGAGSAPATGPQTAAAAAAAAAAGVVVSGAPGTAPSTPSPVQAKAPGTESPLSAAERIGTSPIQIPTTSIPQAAAAPPATPVAPTADTSQNPEPSPKPSPLQGQAPGPMTDPVAAIAAAGAGNAAGAAGKVGGGTQSNQLSFSNTSSPNLGQEPTSPSFQQHQHMASPSSSNRGSRVLMLAGVAVVAFLLLGGAAIALVRSATGDETVADQADNPDQVDTNAGDDPASPATNPANGQGGGNQDGDDQGGQQDQTNPTAGQTDTTAGRTDTTAGQGTNNGNVTTTHHDNTTSTDTETTTTTEDTTTTTVETTTTTEDTTTTTEAVTAQPIRIISRPRVNSRGPTSFQFSYTTNDVCGSGGFTVTEKASGQSAGSFRGNDVCFGPVHGGHPNGGSATFAGFDLNPGTTYRVTVTVRGTASDGTKPAGEGSASASFEVTTTS